MAVKYNAEQYRRSFIPTATSLWNALPTHVVESEELKKFKEDVHRFFPSENTFSADACRFIAL